jgi:hypothetical protein
VNIHSKSKTTMASQGDNPSLGDLPPEIFINVLEACPSPQALRALALTSRNFYELFKGSEERLTSMVMQRMIHPSVQHDAAIAARAARLPPDDPDSRCNNRFWVGIAEPVPAGPSSSSRARPPVSLPPPVVWNLAGALVAVRIHEAVCYFSDRLLADLLRRRPFVDAEGRPTTGADWPPTPTEISRIQSALYRFQTLCELFKRQQEGDARPSLNSWLRRSPQLAAPQMEQLCIINDLLMSLVAKGTSISLSPDLPFSSKTRLWLIFCVIPSLQ